MRQTTTLATCIVNAAKVASAHTPICFCAHGMRRLRRWQQHPAIVAGIVPQLARWLSKLHARAAVLMAVAACHQVVPISGPCLHAVQCCTVKTAVGFTLVMFLAPTASNRAAARTSAEITHRHSHMRLNWASADSRAQHSHMARSSQPFATVLMSHSFAHGSQLCSACCVRTCRAPAPGPANLAPHQTAQSDIWHKFSQRISSVTGTKQPAACVRRACRCRRKLNGRSRCAAHRSHHLARISQWHYAARLQKYALHWACTVAWQRLSPMFTPARPHRCKLTARASARLHERDPCLS